MAMPSTSDCAASRFTSAASFNQTSSFMSWLPIDATCTPLHVREALHLRHGGDQDVDGDGAGLIACRRRRFCRARNGSAGGDDDDARLPRLGADNRPGDCERGDHARDETCCGCHTGSSVSSYRAAGLAAYGLPPSALEIAVIARCARTLLPASSSGGDTTAMPNLPGDTAMMPPPTPLFAGRPV